MEIFTLIHLSQSQRFFVIGRNCASPNTFQQREYDVPIAFGVDILRTEISIENMAKLALPDLFNCFYLIWVLDLGIDWM